MSKVRYLKAGFTLPINMGQETHTQLAKKIQWACNTQLDLVQHYETLHGYASIHEIWPVFRQQLNEFLAAEVQLGMDQHLAENLFLFLVEHPSAYHVEMSSTEMVEVFLEFLKNE